MKSKDLIKNGKEEKNIVKEKSLLERINEDYSFKKSSDSNDNGNGNDNSKSNVDSKLIKKESKSIKKEIKDGFSKIMPQSTQNESNIINNTNVNSKNTISKKDKWQLVKSDKVMIYNPFSLTLNNEISHLLSFDLDSTLIENKSGKVKSISINDWQFICNNIDDIIHNYITKTYDSSKLGICIFSNQKNILDDKAYLSLFKKKLEAVIESLNKNHPLKFIAFVSTDSGYYRKPSTGMFELMKKDYFPKLEKSLYVGDAAGRKSNYKGKKDFADTDLKFALNCGIDFMVPENFFNLIPNYKFKHSLKPYVFKQLGEQEKDKYSFLNKDCFIIMVGYPGSGKSTFFKTYLEQYGFIRVNNDTTGNENKSLKLLEDKISENNKRFVIDNTNPSIGKRRIFINIAKNNNLPCICILFNITRDMVLHLNNQRKILSDLKEEDNSIQISSKPVPTIAVNMFKSAYEEPKLNEGFESIVKVDFEYVFISEIHKKTLFMFSEYI